MTKYFVCYKERSWIDEAYARKFYNTNKSLKIHETYSAAYKELREGFYDDCDYDVYETSDGIHFKRCKS